MTIAGRLPVRDIDARALADEIVAEAGDLDVRDDAAALDFRIDEADPSLAALLGAVILQAARADLHGVAGPHELRVPLGKVKAQDVVVFCEGRDRFAGQHDAAFGNGHGQNAAGAGGQNGSFSPLLFYDAAVGLHRGEIAFGDVESGARLIQLRLRADAAALEILNSIKVGSA